jgi:hypothetical protein
MNMTTKKKGEATLERKVTMLVTSDMVLDLYAKAKKAKGSEKKVLMERVVFLSQHLNHYTPLIPSHFHV